jgi:hypothetical protein
MAYYVTAVICNAADPDADDVFRIRKKDITQELLQKAHKDVNAIYLRLSEKEENRDVVAKGSELLASIRKQLPAKRTEERATSNGQKKRRIKDVLKATEFVW